MKKITAGITVIACVALCAAVWPRIAEVGDLPVGQVKTAVTAKIEARSEEKPHILISADIPTPAARAVTGSEQPITAYAAAKRQRDRSTPTP